jgi:adenosylcobyric acid synthase
LLWPVIDRSLKKLLAEHELVLIEGAGSPAETNLRHTDLANMRTAMAAEARVLLVTDMDRGGAFAHLYGTWALLPEAERALLAGFVLNKFRGDPALLPPAPEDLERLTGVPTLGVIPWLHHGLPDEDGAATPATLLSKFSVAVVRYPTASNLDEYKLLEQVVDLRWADQPQDIEHSDLVILPGSKHVAADLGWLASTGMAKAVSARARRGRLVLGICGGLQMLGERVEDEGGVDGSADGLGLLPVRTTFKAAKLTERVSYSFNSLSPPWQGLSCRSFSGYQIRHGVTTATGPVAEALPNGLGYVSGAVLGIYVHGIFEEPAVLTALFDEQPARSLDVTFDELADAIEQHLDVSLLLAKAGVS